MAEYIDKQAVLNDMIHYLGIKSKDYLLPAERALYKRVEQAPAADVVERKSCNTCQYYEGVHNAMGCAPCSFLNIGCIMWNDFCSRWKGENDG